MGLHGSAAQEGQGLDWEVTKRLGAYLLPYKRHIWLAMGAMAFTVVAQVAGPPLIGYAVDHGVEEGRLDVVVFTAIVYFVLQAAGYIGLREQLINMAIAGQSVIRVLRDELFTHIQRLSMSFFPTYETGRLIARVIGDVNVLREAISFALVGIVRDFFTVIGMLIAMLLIDPALTVIALGVALMLSIIANFWRIHARRAYIRVRETNADVNAELAENINGVRVVKAYAREGYNLQRFSSDINQRNKDSNLHATKVASLFFPSIDLIGGVATGLLIYIGGSLVLEERLSVFKLLTFVLYIEQFFFPIRMLAQRVNIFQATMAAGGKIFWLLDRPVDIQDSPDAQPIGEIRGDIELKDVTMAYVDDQPVLKDINLKIPAGATVALVGHTGAGKTTITKLISRFYETTQGQVLVDGKDVREVTLHSLRSQMGVVLQQNTLFTGTVMQNIRYGRLDASDEEVIEAAKAVGAHEFITGLEKGYHSSIEEGGVLLSVGQRQLIAFARALLADPRILILDEATSNIDTQTEKVIQTALNRLLKGRTSLVIAHRLSTIVNADLIVVMDHGKIMEQGTHQELLQKRGIYYKLYSMSYADVA